MNRSFVPVSLAFAFAFAPLAAQSIDATLVVRSGPSDIVLNGPLLEALLSKPELADAVRKVAGAFRDLYVQQISLPAAHLPGTYQVEVHLNVAEAVDWSPAKQTAGADAAAAFLRGQLQRMLYEEPMARLSERRVELQQRLRDVAEHRASRLLQRRHLQADAAAMRTRLDDLERQLLNAQIALATERRASARLDELRATLTKQRDEAVEGAVRREQLRLDLEREIRALDERLATLTGKPDDQASRQALADQLTALQQRVAELRATDGITSLRGQDAQGLLAAALEQVPSSMLAVQRAAAQLDSLQARRDDLQAQLAKVEQESGRSELETDLADLLVVDIDVCRSLLVEVEGKLARLESVRVERL